MVVLYRKMAIKWLQFSTPPRFNSWQCDNAAPPHQEVKLISPYPESCLASQLDLNQQNVAEVMLYQFPG